MTKTQMVSYEMWIYPCLEFSELLFGDVVVKKESLSDIRMGVFRSVRYGYI